MTPVRLGQAGWLLLAVVLATAGYTQPHAALALLCASGAIAALGVLLWLVQREPPAPAVVVVVRPQTHTLHAPPVANDVQRNPTEEVTRAPARRRMARR